MIKITLNDCVVLDFKGKRCVLNLNPLKLGDEVEPSEVFSSFRMREGSEELEVDYANATDEEKKMWLPAEIIFRILRAIENGMPVKFQEEEFLGDDPYKVAEKLLGKITASGCKKIRVKDDEAGLTIFPV